MTAMTAVNAAMGRDLVNHPLAMMLFGSLVMLASLQWHQFAMFISERCMTSLHQIEDPKEAWLFTAEIVKGVFSELHKIRVMAADRTSATEFVGCTSDATIDGRVHRLEVCWAPKAVSMLYQSLVLASCPSQNGGDSVVQGHEDREQCPEHHGSPGQDEGQVSGVKRPAGR
jgi:hypothetical protein